MINAKDFRIGNLVNWDMYENCVVGGIIAYQLTKDTLHLTGIRDGKEFIVNAAIGDVKPIKLTDEYLINKSNFLMIGNYYVFYSEDLVTSLRLIPSNDGYFYPQIFQEPEMSNESEQAVCLTRIKFIHELQNLIYTLFKK